MSAFFTTPEFQFLKKLQQHIEILYTEKNYSVYKKYLKKCKELSKEKYKNIGWREDSESYAWDKLDVEKIGPPMNNCGDDSDGVCFYPGATLFMSDDLTHWAVKHEDGIVVKYSEEETDELLDKSIDDLIKIHDIKKTFEGSVLGG